MPRKRLLLIGWDSADWKIIHPLVDAGLMPAMARMLEKGVAGNLTTLEPQLSPMLWTSIATGKHAYHHGVAGFTEVNAAGEVVPVSAATRQCQALWEMLAQSGLKSHVVSWFATHGEQPNGCLVSNLYNSWKHAEADDAAQWPPPPHGTYWPADLGEHLNERRVSPWDIDPDQILRLFVPRAAEIDQKNDPRLWQLTQQLSEAFTVHAATCWLLENRPDWDFTAVYYRAIDEICHRFMPYHPPRLDMVSEADFDLYQGVVAAAYRLHDLFLVALMRLAGPDTALMLVSDHGFHSDHLRPKFTPRVPAGITIWHRPQGVIAAMGPGFQQDCLIHGARLLDVAPTVLAWFGLPIGEDMEGRVLADAFSTPPALTTVPSWEDPHAAPRQVQELPRADQQALLDQFADLGYIERVSEDPGQAVRETERENKWNLARACIDGGRYAQALPMLEEIHTLRPQRDDYAQLLCICQSRLGLLDEAQVTADGCRTRHGESPAMHLLLANIALERDDASAALEHLAAARTDAPADLQFLVLLSRAQQQARQWDEAATTCQQVLALDPANPYGLLGLARCALRRGQPAAAAEHALAAIGQQFGNPRGHFLLGSALCQLGDWPAAVQALETATRLAPQLAPAHRQLAVARRALGDLTGSGQALAQARLARHFNRGPDAGELAGLREASAQRRPVFEATRERRMAAEQARLAAAEAEGLAPDQEFIVVSGLPRSGTSLMMQMLRAGGLELMSDGTRAADEDNPEGYWEWEDIRKLPQNPRLIEQAFGKVTKVVSALLPHLTPRHRYKVIFMTRPPEQVVESQLKMLAHSGRQPKSEAAHLIAAQRKHAAGTLAALRASDRFEVLELDYPALVADPAAGMAALAAFLPGVFQAGPAVLAAVKPALHRNRQPAAEGGRLTQC